MQRTTNNIGGDGGEKTSVKVNYAPGGKSSFSLGWGNDDPAPTQKTITRKYNNESSIFGGQDNKKTPYEERKQPTDGFGKIGASRTTNNIGGDGGEKTSVKVHYAPGGQSSISFGSDNYYEPPTRKQDQYVPTSIYGDQSTSSSTTTTQTKTSVKVHNPPGGKSSITFGQKRWIGARIWWLDQA